MQPLRSASTSMGACSRSTATRTGCISWAVRGGNLVLKFYRPERWTDAQIAEEHQFTAEMAAAELPVAAPVQIDGATLFEFRDFASPRFPGCAGGPRSWMPPMRGSSSGAASPASTRSAPCGPSRPGPRHRSAALGCDACNQVLASELLPEVLRDRYVDTSEALLGRVEAGLSSRRRRCGRSACTATAIWAICCGMSRGPPSSTWTTARPARASRTCGCCWPAPASDQHRQWGELLEGYPQFADFDFREVALIEPLRALRMLHHAAWVSHRWQDPAFPRLSVVWRASLLGGLCRGPA